MSRILVVLPSVGILVINSRCCKVKSEEILNRICEIEYKVIGQINVNSVGFGFLAKVLNPRSKVKEEQNITQKSHNLVSIYHNLFFKLRHYVFSSSNLSCLQEDNNIAWKI